MSSENAIHIAIELSVSSWLVAVNTVSGATKSRLLRLDGGDASGLLKLIAELQTRVSTHPGDVAEVSCCFEAGRDGFWLYRLLTAHGIAAYVLEPTSILVNRRARRAKTDRLDAEGMLRVLAAWLNCDRQICSMVRVPTPDEEGAKRTHREREHLVQERLRIENRIEALLFTQGIRGRPSLRSWERDVATLRTGDGRELPPLLRAELDRLRRRLLLALELIRELETERAKTLDAAATDDLVARKIVSLKQIRGIGENFAAVLVREVFYRRFDNRRQLASYVGITPMPYQSGGVDRDRSISRAGNPRARTAMIQLAWLWLRYQPASGLATWFRERVGTLKGRTRRIAIVAMARKLLIALWRYVETGSIPDGLAFGTGTTAG
ncbi:IS110 family RNA-guided transposase [Acetobacter tropicalis]|uniref:IS110 family transposase n=1 Tax=Acetobacter tropicalis TaxID=104102 RepID=UPI00165717A9|nr:IS110 family transposase [Acetobacter tropicalis]MBC9008937.1 IS110 family transposase [Acetobacter tropicalis]